MKAAVNACMSGKSAFYEGNYLSVTGGKISNLKADYGPILSAEGEVIGGIGIIEDISERKQTEQALHESERQLHLLSGQLLAAQEQERKRIARELHDGIGSSLSAIKFSIEAALRRMRQSSPAYESLQNLIVLTQHAIDESRRIMTDLRPPILDDFGILTTLDWFCAQFRKVYTDIKVEKEIDVKEEEIPEALKIVVFRLVQEAFHNTAKYSQASQVKVCLRKTVGTIELRISDDGIGFDRTASSRPIDANVGLGLPSMKERTELSGGRFSIESAEGMGTTLCATWSCST
jgi:signal transduction histidine kinase